MASASASATDLVGEFHRRNLSRRRRRTVTTIALLILAVVLAAFGAAAWVYWRITENLALAAESCERGDVEGLVEASTVLERNLRLFPEHGPTRQALATVQALRALLLGEDPRPLRAEIADESDVSVDLDVIRAALALLDNDLEQAETVARRALTAKREGDAPLVPRSAAWMYGLAALQRVDRPGAPAEALAALAEVVGEPPAHVELRRTIANLHFRAGDGERARTLLGAPEPAEVVLATDLALIDALSGRATAPPPAAVTALASTEPAPLGRGRARLVAAVLACRERGRPRCGESLDAAHDDLPRWDHDARDHAFEVAVLAGEDRRMERWIDATPPLEGAVPMHRAAIDLARGDAAAALATLAELPQDHPRVAYLQAVALVEQERLAEARPWIDRARLLLGDRIELAVADARITTTGDAAALERALVELRGLAEREPGAFRIHTALGKAELRKAELGGDKAEVARAGAEAERALATAVEHEPRPAEAALQLARIRLQQAQRQPERAGEALQLLARAVELNPHVTRFRAEHGIQLANLGREGAAEPLLREVAGRPDAPVPALLRLVQLVADRADAGQAEIGKEVETWLQRAADAGTPPPTLDLLRARLDVARKDPLSEAQAQATLQRLLAADPRDLEARLLYGKLLLRHDPDAAAALAREGLRYTSKRRDGRLYLLLATADLAAGRGRQAAGLAWTAWKKVLAEHRPIGELFQAAAFTRDLWLSIGQDKGARTVGRDLSEHAPHLAEAWVFRGEIQLDAEFGDWACESAEKAMALEPKLAGARALDGACKAQRGDLAGARAAYEQAIKLARGTPDEQRYRKRMRRL